MLVFEPTDYDSIKAKMDEFMDLVRSTHFPFVKKANSKRWHVSNKPYDFPITVLENADKALYYAKENGRDMLCFYEALLSEHKIEIPEGNTDIDLF